MADFNANQVDCDETTPLIQGQSTQTVLSKYLCNVVIQKCEQIADFI